MEWAKLISELYIALLLIFALAFVFFRFCKPKG